MLPFCEKTIVKESCKFELARKKKRKRRRRRRRKKSILAVWRLSGLVLSRFSSSSSSSSFSDGLVQICVTLSRWFSHKTAAFFTEQCTSPSLFPRFEVTRGDSNRSLKNYGFLYDAIFSSRVHMRTNHLATKCNYYARLLN